jgi:hypothetical protein
LRWRGIEHCGVFPGIAGAICEPMWPLIYKSRYPPSGGYYLEVLLNWAFKEKGNSHETTFNVGAVRNGGGSCMFGSARLWPGDG